MSTWQWTIIWLVIFLAVVGGTIWYGMSLLVEADISGVPLPYPK